MTECPRADMRDLLPDWVHGTLEPEAAAEVREHLAVCAACAEEAELLAAMRGTISAQAPAIDTATIAARVVHRTVARPPRRAAWAVIGTLAVAASVALTAVFVRTEDPRTAPPPVASRAPVTAPPAVASAASAGIQAPATDSGEGAAPAPPGARQASPAPALRLATAELPVGGGLADLDDAALERLLRRIDALDGLPSESPDPTIVTSVEVQE